MSCPALVALVALAQNGAAADPPWRPCVARVVDGATHVPVAGVEVWWLDRDELPPEEARLVRDRELVPEEWIRRLGHHTTTDAVGDAALPRARRGPGRVAVVWHDGKFARFDWSWDFEVPRIVALELEDDSPQLIRVVDAAGAPLAGVEVAAWCMEEGICLNCGPSDDHIWSEPTDAKGEVKLPHADWFFHSDGGVGNLGRRLHLVGLGFPVRKPKWVGLESRTGDPGAIELVAPPLESAELELQSASGVRCSASAWVSLASVEERRQTAETWGTGRPFGSFLARDGRLALRHVERDFPLLVSYASDPASGSAWDDVESSPADSSSSDAPRPFRANRRLVFVRGRAIDREHHPWALARVAAADAGPDPKDDVSQILLDSHVTRCDADGRFSWSPDWIESDRLPDWISAWVFALAIDEGEFRPATGIPTRVSIQHAAEIHGVEIDLGDIELAPPALRVAGRVVDEAGRPLPGVRLSVEDVPVGVVERDHMALPTTDEEGRFAVHGGDFEREIEVESMEPGWRLATVRVRDNGQLGPPTMQIPLGRSDVELVLVEYGGVRGRVVMPEGMRARDLELDVRGDRRGRLDFYPDGTFEARTDSDAVVIEVHSKADKTLLACGRALVPESGLIDDPDLVIDLRAPAKK